MVDAIRRVTDLACQISSPRVEQSSGVAMVEQSAAAAESLMGQARPLVASVAVFRLG